MRKRILMVAGMSLVLSACGGGGDPLAQLCVDEAVKGLEGQVYRLDEKQLAKNKTVGENGNVTFVGEVILKPGTSGETKQTLDCVVEPATAEAPARVIRFRFNVSGSGLAS
jgi:hypothetical protein